MKLNEEATLLLGQYQTILTLKLKLGYDKKRELLKNKNRNYSYSSSDGYSYCSKPYSDEELIQHRTQIETIDTIGADFGKKLQSIKRRDREMYLNLRKECSRLKKEHKINNKEEVQTLKKTIHALIMKIKTSHKSLSSNPEYIKALNNNDKITRHYFERDVKMQFFEENKKSFTLINDYLEKNSLKSITYKKSPKQLGDIIVHLGKFLTKLPSA